MEVAALGAIRPHMMLKPVIPPRKISDEGRRLVKSPPKRRKLWFGILDADMCIRIVSYVCRGEQNEFSLRLAETTPELRRAVMYVLSDRVRIHWNTTLGARWSMVAVENIRCVAISTNTRKWAKSTNSMMPSNAFAPLNPLMLLQASTLRRAEVFDEPGMLWALRGSTSLRELLIRMATQTDFQIIWDTLASLNLEILELECCWKTSHVGACPNIHFAQYVKSLMSTTMSKKKTDPSPRLCPNLSTIRMSCWTAHGIHPLGDWLCFFPKLRHVTVTSYREDPSHALSKFTPVESVRIMNAQHSFQLAMHLGPSVTFLYTMEYLDKDQVDRISKCNRLVRLGIGIKEGAEQRLVENSILPKLESLQLRWSPLTVPSPRNNGCVGQYTLTAATPGVMLRVIELATSLFQVDLLHVRINWDELNSILRCMGPRLRAFKTSLRGQAEKPLDRLENIVGAMLLNNQNLLYFDIEEDISHGNQDADQSISIQACRIRAALRRLQLRAPMMQATRLFWSVRALIKDVVLYQPGTPPVRMEEANNRWYWADSEEMLFV